MNKIYAAAFALIVFGGAFGCTQRYGITVENLSNEPIRADVRLGDFSVGLGHPLHINAKDSAGFYPVPVPVPKSATVWWQTDDGRIYERVVQVAESLPRNVSHIFFVIRDDRVGIVGFTKKQFRNLDYPTREIIERSVE